MKLRILFDATILSDGLQKTCNRSGIFWAALGIFRALGEREDVEIGIYSAPSFVDSVNKFLEREFPGRGYRAINRTRSCFLGCIRDKILSLQEIPANKRGLRQKCLAVCRLAVKVASFIWDKHVGCRRTVRLFDGYDAFYSPFKIPPMWIRKRSRVRRFMQLHDAIPMIFPQFWPFAALGFSWNRELVYNLSEDDFCFADSECTRHDFLRFNKRLRPENVIVTPLAADGKFYRETNLDKIAAARVKYNIPTDARYVFSLCTIEPRKNFERSLEAFCNAAESLEDESTIFVVAGGMWARYESKWNAILSRFSGKRNRILPIGYVDDDDLAALYSGAELFVYPSLYEGFGLPPLEAMQCGTPVVTSNTSSLPEVVGDAAITVDPTSVDELASAIGQVLSDEGLRASLSEKGLARAKEFSWSRTADAIVNAMAAELGR